MFAMDNHNFVICTACFFALTFNFLIKAGITLMVNCNIHAQYYTLVIINVVAQKKGNSLYQLIFPYSCKDPSVWRSNYWD